MKKGWRALVLIGHGSRKPDHRDVLDEMADQLRAEFLGLRVEVAFMSLCDPPLEEVIRRLVHEGAQEITVLPCFLFRGVHVTEDIPRMLADLRQAYPSVRFFLAEGLGDPKRLGSIAKERCLAVWAGNVPF